MIDMGGTPLGEFIALFRVTPGKPIVLSEDFDPSYRAGIRNKAEGFDVLQSGIAILSEYQARLAAQDTYGVLVCLQALDAAGKDGTIRHVMSGVNPQGVSVHGFKAPSAEELEHDYLWRYAKRLPRRGGIGIFNRSHYEEVVVVRVHDAILQSQKLPDEAKDAGIWARRYREINDWERYLTDNGYRVVKIFLNLSKEEQRKRFLKRIDLADHNWKFSANDAAERKHWDAYQHAFSEMLSATSTPCAPWYVIPADRKWFSRVASAAVLAVCLMEIDPHFPTVSTSDQQELLHLRDALIAEAPEGATPDPFLAEVGPGPVGLVDLGDISSASDTQGDNRDPNKKHKGHKKHKKA